MRRFINSKKTNYYKDIITNFSDTSSLVSSGVVKGFSDKKYSWVADFLFKHRTNTATNIHTSSISFFNDREIVYAEYGNIPDVYTTYPFLQSYSRQKYSPYTYELSSKQYRKIGQRYSEFDVIEYINASGKEEDEVGIFVLNHKYKDAPVFHAEGYRMDGYSYNKSKFIWVNPGENRAQSDVSSFQIDLGTDQSESFTTPQAAEIASAPGNITRILDHKIKVNHDNYFYFQNLDEWVVYPYLTGSFHGGNFEPYFGHIICYQDNKDIDHMTGSPTITITSSVATFSVSQTSIYMKVGNKVTYDTDKVVYLVGTTGTPGEWNVLDINNEDVIDATTETVVSITHVETNVEIQPDSVTYFPRIITKGRLEPAKIIIEWSENITGKCALNTGNSQQDGDDQSRMVFNLPHSMFNLESGDIKIYSSWGPIYGIDLKTERNRRHSATVMVEPYFTVEPINSGTLIEYEFINKSGTPVSYAAAGAYRADPGQYLKIKSDLGTIRELDRLLTLEEYNTDIINTLTIANPDIVLPAGSGWYTNFNSVISQFHARQEANVSDLIGGYIGEPGVGHYVFEINKYGAQQDLYTTAMNVAGLGYYNMTEIDAFGNITGETSYLSVYCTNYTTDTIKSTETFMNDADSSNITRVEQYERFRPMIKLDGMNGYIKILRKNKHIPATRTADGAYEAIYIIEFPYCAGSYSTRYQMNFPSTGYKSTQLLYKKAYISAGSEEVVSAIDAHYENKNNRYEWGKNDVFSTVEFSSSGNSVETAYYKNGGGMASGKVLKSTLTYPTSSVSNRIVPELVSADVEDTGTAAHAYQVFISGSPSVNELDYKLFLLADNQKWKFDDQFESYIERENPSYIYEINASTLYNSYEAYQKENSSIPDLKRWLYAYFKGLSHTTDMNDVKIMSKSSDSDIIIEIWDKESEVGSTRGGNWRAISPSSADSKKSTVRALSDGLYVYGAGSIITSTGFWRYKLGYYDPPNSHQFPEGFNASELDGLVNKALYDASNDICYHIADINYLSQLDPGQEEGYQVDIEWDSGSDPALPTASADLSIMEPQNFINKMKTFELYSGVAKTSNNCRLLRKYIDIRDETALGDFDRYVEDNKIYFRVRVTRGKEFPTTKIDVDNDGLQFVKEVIINTNNPWKTLGTYNDNFDTANINFTEKISKFGMTYFKCGSK